MLRSPRTICIIVSAHPAPIFYDSLEVIFNVDTLKISRRVLVDVRLAPVVPVHRARLLPMPRAHRRMGHHASFHRRRRDIRRRRG